MGLWVIAWLCFLSSDVAAQDQITPPLSVSPPAEWTLFSDGKEAPWPLQKTLPIDSLDAAVQAILTGARLQGYYFSRIDSFRTQTAHQPTQVAIYLTPGPEVRLGQVELVGMSVLDSLKMKEGMETREGYPLIPEVLENDLDVLLQSYEAVGYPLANARIETLTLSSDYPPALLLTIRVDEGMKLFLSRVELTGVERTKAAYVSRVAGIQPGREMVNYSPEDIQRRLRETAFFSEVGEPELVLGEDGKTILRISLKEASPGSFDLVLGYLPPAGQGRSGSIVGNGHLVMRNIFGGGRVMGLKLNRLPGQVSSVDAEFTDPFILGLPFGFKGRFEGLQQDSTYGKQRYLAELDYRFTGNLQAFLNVSRETTNPGKAGLQLGAEGQRIPRSSAVFGGLGMRYQKLDRPRNPRKGAEVSIDVERGRKSISTTMRTLEGDTTLINSSVRQERLNLTVRKYFPTIKRQVLVVGGEARYLVSDILDESDLFRFGGATTLRGYDEDRFRGRFVARFLSEYRYLIDRTSFAFLFFDLGYVDTPQISGFEASQHFYPGYGFGMQFGTNLGLVNVSYAINTEDGPTNGRVHVGLSFGL